MIHRVRLLPVSTELIELYCQIGKEAYTDHYAHLWPNGDTNPYVSRNLQPDVVKKELENVDNAHFLIHVDGVAVGILKLVLNAAVQEFDPRDAILLEKVYLKAAFTGKGIGSAVLTRVIEKARRMEKRVLWLDTMQKGPALKFYLDAGFEIAGEQNLPIPGVLDDEKAMFILLKRLNTS